MSTIVATNIEDLDTGDTVSVSNLITINDQRTNYGLVPSNNSGDITNDIDFTAGKCWDTTGTNYITVAAMTKRADATWAAGTNQGMMDTGTFALNKVYYFWAIRHTDGTTDILCSLEDDWASVTKPTGYTLGQLIHALPTVRTATQWLVSTIIGDEVDFDPATSVVPGFSIASNSATVKSVNLPKLTVCRLSVAMGVGVPQSAMQLSTTNPSRVGLTNTHLVAYVALTTLELGSIGAVTSEMVDANGQIAFIGIYNVPTTATVTCYGLGYRFNRRFAGA